MADITDIADSFEPEIRRRLLELFAQLQDRVPLNPLTDALESGSFDAVMEVLSRVQLDPDDLKFLQTTLIDTGETAARASGVELRFDVVPEAVIRWAERHVAEMVTGVTSETKQAIREIVTGAIQEGVAPREQARMIQNIVGLTRRDAAAVARLQAGFDDPTTKTAMRQIERMSRRLLRRRAQNIARTETMMAANRGQLEAWRQTSDDGLFNRQEATKVWIVTDDDRLCPRCAPLDGMVIGFDDDFNEEGKADSAVPVPPLHPSCRCTVGLQFGPADAPTQDPRSYFEAEGIELDVPDDYDIDTLRAFAEAHANIKDKFPVFSRDLGLGPLALRKIKVGGTDPLTLAQYRGGTLNLSPRGIAGRDILRRQHARGLLASPDALGIAHHELSHALRYAAGSWDTTGEARILDRILRAGRKNVWGTDSDVMSAAISRDISRYATEDLDEFFSEVFASRHNPASWEALKPDAQRRIMEFAEFVNTRTRDKLGWDII